MQRIDLGNSLQLSQIVYGMWRLAPSATSCCCLINTRNAQ